MTRAEEIEQAASVYAHANPKVWALFVRFTFQLIHAGRSHYSAKAVFERIRWHVAIDTEADDFKINNNYTSVFARWFHRQYPAHDGFFRLRERPSERD